MTTRKKLKTDIALVEPDRITVRSLDLSKDILGKIDLGGMAFLQLKKRLPTPQESVVFNAITVAFVEHGIEPSTLTARMIYFGAPEAMQAAIAAGLCAMGDEMAGTMENAARMLQEALPDPKARVDLETLAEAVVKKYAPLGKIPGVGHDFHVREDPRSARLFEITRENGFEGRYVNLMHAIGRKANAHFGKIMPLNAPGAVGAIASELGLPWQIVRGIAVMARAIGLVGHILEELQDPMVPELLARVREEATSHLRRGA